MSEQQRPETEPCPHCGGHPKCLPFRAWCETEAKKEAEKFAAPYIDWKTRAEKAEAELEKANNATDAAGAPKQCLERDMIFAKPKNLTISERIEWLGKDRDNWETRAKAKVAEAELVRTTLVSKIPVVTHVPQDWQRVRINAAIAAMQGHINHRGSNVHPDICVWAIKHADALVAELKKDEKK